MDWGNVSVEDLVEALREVDWSTPPRTATEFFQKFSLPKKYKKWTSRAKCNLYYYRTNYFAIIVITLLCAFARNPLALAAVLLAGISAACLNDSFAISLNDRATKVVRRIHPPLAAKLRPPQSRTGVRGRPLKGGVTLLGQDRRVVVGALACVCAFLWYRSSALLTVCGAILLGAIFCALHATFRSPNLKARLNSFQEEFRAAWRGYSDAP